MRVWESVLSGMESQVRGYRDGSESGDQSGVSGGLGCETRARETASLEPHNQRAVNRDSRKRRTDKAATVKYSTKEKSLS